MNKAIALYIAVTVGLIGCAGKQAIEAKQPPSPQVSVSNQACNCPPTIHPCPAVPENPNFIESKPDDFRIPDYSLLKRVKWQDVENFTQDDFLKVWPAWIQSCSALKSKQGWQEVCEMATKIVNPTKWEIINYFKQNFEAFRATNQDGSDTGMITGYYEPVVRGSLTKSETYRYPLYSRPDDLITVELASIFPELSNKRVRGRLVGNKLVPYYNRGEIEIDPSPLQGHELLWVDDSVDLFFLQIQGSGLVKLNSGEQIHVGYADQNGQAYQSIGRLLIDKGELSPDKASMQGIKNWAHNNPNKMRELLNANPSYVFFKELPAGLPGPLGALGVPIIEERSVAIDPKFIPLGAPVFLSSTYPNSNKALNKLVLAQDTGGAIKGGVRADFFWGSGEDAAKQAGAMKQIGRIWVLLPKEFNLPK